jgi:hypothetical protein
MAMVLLAHRAAALPTRPRPAPEAGSPWFCHGIECPPFTVLETNKSSTPPWELRSYPSALWVSTNLEFATGEELEQATYEGFRRLFAYIAGANAEEEKVEMTAPVLNEITPGQGPFCKSNLTLAFYVPQAFQTDGPPKPTADNVYVSKMPAQSVYVYGAD